MRKFHVLNFLLIEQQNFIAIKTFSNYSSYIQSSMYIAIAAV